MHTIGCQTVIHRLQHKTLWPVCCWATTHIVKCATWSIRFLQWPYGVYFNAASAEIRANIFFASHGAARSCCQGCDYVLIHDLPPSPNHVHAEQYRAFRIVTQFERLRRCGTGCLQRPRNCVTPPIPLRRPHFRIKHKLALRAETRPSRHYIEYLLFTSPFHQSYDFWRLWAGSMT